MKLIKVAAAILNQTPLDWDRNTRNIRAAIQAARADGVSVLCLPEMCIPGYGCEDAFFSAGVRETSLAVLRDLLPETTAMIVSIGLPLPFRGSLYNGAALAVDGRLVGITCKRYLPGDGIHYEPRWFRPWPGDARETMEIHGVDVPLGDVHYDIGGIRLGFEICEDAWVAKRTGGDLGLAGADVLLNPSASHFAFGKHDIRERFVLEGARAFGVTYVYANLIGNEAGRIIYDGGALIASDGEMVARGPRFTYQDQVVTSAVIDVELTRAAHHRRAGFEPTTETAATEWVEIEFDWPQLEPSFGGDAAAAWEGGPHRKEEEFTRAVALGLHDYLVKSRARGFVVSLSGGADSAAVACLVALMVELAADELGIDRLRERLAGGPTGSSPRALVFELLTTVYQSTRNSSTTTRDAARAVAEAIGSRHFELDVDAQVASYTELIETALGRTLGWQTDDAALQNVQARARGPSVWLLANLAGALLLATSNRSEAAVGYATMDGDTCGGLSPIAGIDKAFLRTWLAWLESVGPAGAQPIPALAVVTAQAPTAELRPPGANQTDEDDLMPYPILDEVERLAIGDKRTPLEVWRILRERHDEPSDGDLLGWVERFFLLWCRNQWKRERYAPSFHLDDENLDPKTWCRFPILSGGYERELDGLRRYVAARGDA